MQTCAVQPVLQCVHCILKHTNLLKSLLYLFSLFFTLKVSRSGQETTLYEVAAILRMLRDLRMLLVCSSVMLDE